jgi:hypothetical protein
LIVVAEEDDEALRIQVERAGISMARRGIEDQIRRYKEESPEVRFPAVKVMTEAMLIEYVEGSASRRTIH